MDMLDMIDQMDPSCVDKEDKHEVYFRNIHPRQKSEWFSEVNISFLREITTESVSMKLRRSIVLKSESQDLQKYEAEVIPLTDSDSSLSDSSDGLKDHSSDSHDFMQPVRKCRAAASFLQKSNIFTTQPDRGVKISLAPGTMAEDTLENLRSMSNVSEISEESSPTSFIKSQEVWIDSSCADFTSTSGPSSPCHLSETVRCKACKQLFAKVRRLPLPKHKSRNKNPKSLSCDVWLLLKKWHPHKLCHRKRGLLWTSLNRIWEVKRLSEDSGFSDIHRTSIGCSRPHVFQQRNVRRCKHLHSIHSDLSMSRAKSLRRNKAQTEHWPPVAGWKSTKRKPSKNTSQHFPLNLSVRIRKEGIFEDSKVTLVDPEAPEEDSEAPVVDPEAPEEDSEAQVVDPEALEEDSEAQVVDPEAPEEDSEAPKEGPESLIEDKVSTRSVDWSKTKTYGSGRFKRQNTSVVFDGTQWALKFDESCGTRIKIPKQNCEVVHDIEEDLSEDSYEFRTPPYVYCVKPQIKQRKKVKRNTT